MSVKHLLVLDVHMKEKSTSGLNRDQRNRFHGSLFQSMIQIILLMHDLQHKSSREAHKDRGIIFMDLCESGQNHMNGIHNSVI